MKITIDTIPHANQRYETTGDWVWSGPHCAISVSEMGDWRFEALVGIHEAVEALLCRSDDVSGAAVDAFDFEYEAARERKFPTPDGFKFYFRDITYDADSEPGDCTAAPYYAQHQTATYIEYLLARKLGVDRKSYERAVEAANRDATSPTA